MGSDDGYIGINSCVLTYHPQLFRYSGQGQLINDDFCMTLTEEKPGAVVSMTKSKVYRV